MHIFWPRLPLSPKALKQPGRVCLKTWAPLEHSLFGQKSCAMLKQLNQERMEDERGQLHNSLCALCPVVSTMSLRTTFIGQQVWRLLGHPSDQCSCIRKVCDHDKTTWRKSLRMRSIICTSRNQFWCEADVILQRRTGTLGQTSSVKQPCSLVSAMSLAKGRCKTHQNGWIQNKYVRDSSAG